MFIRIALMVAGSAAIPASLCAQPSGGLGAAPPAPAAVSTTTNAPGPRIQFNTENHDAGTNLAGDMIRFTFVVTNTGDELLILSNVHASCGCTIIGGTMPAAPTSGGGTVPGTTTTWSHEIAPGQTGIIPVQVLTSNLRGPINKTVSVTSNDRARPNVTLHISGVVWLPIEVAPTMATFSLMPDATNINTQVLRIFNRMDTPLTLSDPHSTTNAFSAVLKTNVPGQEFELTVTAVPPPHVPASLGMTVMQGEIALKSSATNKNPLIIPVFATIYPEITVFPLNILLPTGPLAQPSTSHLQVRGNTANLALSDPEVNAPGVEIAVKVLQTNRQYYLDIVFPAGFEARTNENLALTVKTDNPRFPTITVPVTPVPGLPQPRRPAVATAPVRTSMSPGARAGFAVPAASTNAPPSAPQPAAPANTLQP